MLRTLALSLSATFCSLLSAQTIPITPSIVTFHQQTSPWICNNNDSIAIDVNQDSIIDVVIKRNNYLDTCYANFSPGNPNSIIYLNQELNFTSGANSAVISDLITSFPTFIAEEFSIGQTVNLNNYYEVNSGVLLVDFYEKIGTSCVQRNYGSWSRYPHAYHYLISDSSSTVKYHYLIALQYDSTTQCYRIQPPGFTALESIEMPLEPRIIHRNGQLSIIQDIESNWTQAQIIDLQGRITDEFNINASRQDRDVSTISKGIYFIRLLNKESGMPFIKKLFLP